MPETLCTLCKKTVFTSQDKFARHNTECDGPTCEGPGKTVSEVEKMERMATCARQVKDIVTNCFVGK